MRPMNCAGTSADGTAIELLKSEEEDELLQRHGNTAHIPMAISSCSCGYHSWQLVIPPACWPMLEKGTLRLIHEAGSCISCAIDAPALSEEKCCVVVTGRYRGGFIMTKRESLARQAYERTGCRR